MRREQESVEFSVEQIAGLAQLSLSPEEAESLARDFAGILQFAAQMKEPEPVQRTAASPSPLREDIPAPSLPREELLQNAPQTRDGFFVLPRAVGGRDDA